MGRWKVNYDGSRYYDPNDSGPDQIAPPQATEQPAAPMMGDPGVARGGYGPAPSIAAGAPSPGSMTPGAIDRTGLPSKPLPSSGPVLKKPVPMPTGGINFMAPMGGGTDWSMGDGTSGPMDQMLGTFKSLYGPSGTPAAPAQAPATPSASPAPMGMRERLGTDLSVPLGLLGTGQLGGR